MLAVEHLVGKGTKQLLSLPGINRLGNAEMTGQNATHITIKHGIRLPESKAHDGCCGIVANSRQIPHEGIIVRELTSLCNLLGGGMKVAGTTIITQPLPKPHHLFLACLCKALCRWKTLGKAKVVVHPLTNLCLLKDELREHDEVRVACPAPRQIAPKRFVPLL